MEEIYNDKTSTYGNLDKNKTQTYGYSEIQKTATYNSKQDEIATYSDLQNKKLKSRTHGIGVGDKLTLRNNEFTITGIISEETGEAVIYKVENASKQTFVIKLYFEVSDLKKEPNYETLERIRGVNDPNILKLHDFGVGADKYQGRYCYEISDFAEGGDLFSVANFKEKYTKDFLEKSIVPEILNGIKKLHEFKIYHCDLKPSNIFYKDINQTDLLIGDYGSAKAYDLELHKEIMHTITVKGTNYYIPPEQAIGIISEKNDYYSFGLILIHLLYPEQFSCSNNIRQVDEIKFARIREKQYNSQPVIDLNPSFKRLNNLIEGLTLNHHINRFGKNEVEKWLKGEEVEVKYKAAEISTVQPVKLGYATIKTDKDFIEILETKNNWWEDIFEDSDTYSAIKAWLGSYRDIASRKVFDEMIHFYKPYGKDFVKEASIRYFQPERDIQIDMNLFNLFTTDNIHEEVKKLISKLDDIWKITPFEKIRFYLFQLEFSLKQITLTLNGKDLVLVNSIVDKVSSAFGCIGDTFDSRKTQIQDKFNAKNEKESYIKLLQLFYSFNAARIYIDIKNRIFDDINEIALTYANDETLFFDKYCEAELTIYLRKKQLKNLQQNDYCGFLFSVFPDHIKSNLSIDNVKFCEKTAIVDYQFNKSLTEFISTKGINKLIINNGNNNSIELQTTLIPSGGELYHNLILAICKNHSVNEQSFERNSLDETKSQIIKFTKFFIKLQRKEAIPFSSGLVVYSLPVIFALIGVFILLFTPKNIIDYLYMNINSGEHESTIRSVVLIGYIYISIIISLIPAILFWANNRDKTNLHLNFDWKGFELILPHQIVGGIVLYYIVTVILVFVLFFVLALVFGIASIFGASNVDITVDRILNFLITLSTIVVFIVVLRPVIRFYENTQHEEKIVKHFISKQLMTFSIIFIISIFTVFSLVDINIFGFSNYNREAPALDIQSPDTKLYIVMAKVANVRSGPSSKSKVIGQIKRNSIIEVISETADNWYKFKYNNIEAYINKSLIKKKN